MKEVTKMMTIRWRQRRTIGDDEGDDRDDEGDNAKAKRDDGDNGKTQEMKKMMMEEGRIAPSICEMMMEGSKPLQCISLPNTGYIYGNKASTATRVSEIACRSSYLSPRSNRRRQNLPYKASMIRK